MTVTPVPSSLHHHNYNHHHQADQRAHTRLGDSCSFRCYFGGRTYTQLTTGAGKNMMVVKVAGWMVDTHLHDRDAERPSGLTRHHRHTTRSQLVPSLLRTLLLNPPRLID